MLSLGSLIFLTSIVSVMAHISKLDLPRSAFLLIQKVPIVVEVALMGLAPKDPPVKSALMARKKITLVSIFY